MVKKRKAALSFIFITILIDIIGIGLIIPVMPDLIKELIGSDVVDAAKYSGWLMASYAFMQFIFAPMLGSLSDRFGRRPVILIALLGLGLDYILHAFAPTIKWLFIGRLIAGVFGGSITPANAYIADISSGDDRAKNFGLVGAAFGIGFVIGPVIGGLLGELGSRVPFLFAAGLSLLNFTYGLFVLPESLKAENKRKFEFKRANPIGSLLHLNKYPMVLGLVLAYFILYLGGQAIHSVWIFHSMYLFGWKAIDIGLSLGYVGVLIALIQGGLIRPVISKFGQTRTIFIGLFFNLIGLILLSIVGKGQGILMLIFLIPYCLGGLSGPSLQGFISNHVPANEQGELQGAMTSLMMVTSIIGPPLMTGLFHRFSSDDSVFYFPGAPYLAGAVFSVIAITVAYKNLSKLR